MNKVCCSVAAFLKQDKQNFERINFVSFDYSFQVEENPALQHYGIPQQSGLFYAMALALIMEGLMSGIVTQTVIFRLDRLFTGFPYAMALAKR